MAPGTGDRGRTAALGLLLLMMVGAAVLATRPARRLGAVQQYREQAERWGREYGIDPSFAPGVSHPVPGGLTVRPVLDWLRTADWRWLGMDLVELNPERDQGDRSAILAGRLVHEAMGSAFAAVGRP